MVSSSALTYRLRGCPATADEVALREGLARAFDDVAPDDIHIRSLALDLLGTPPTKIATLQFEKMPSIIETQATKGEWKIEGHNLSGTLLLDTHFLGLTPLNEIKAQEHHFE
jgi:hypothetical protein